MGPAVSCSACCGILNLKFAVPELRSWIETNTREFLSLDISSPENIVAYRKQREEKTLPHRVREDTYVCPFVGFVDNVRTGDLQEGPSVVANRPSASDETGNSRRGPSLAANSRDASVRSGGLPSAARTTRSLQQTLRTGDSQDGPSVAANRSSASMRSGRDIEQPRVASRPDASLRTGCLLHPQGSPHPQIGLWEHPQNFSFYGEGICLSYDCLAKERRVFRPDFFTWAISARLPAYSSLAGDHTLHRALAAIADLPADIAPFYSFLARYYQWYGVVITSFEDIEKTLPGSAPELCNFLAQRIANGHRATASRNSISPDLISRRLQRTLLSCFASHL
jgi:hypothetical protein